MTISWKEAERRLTISSGLLNKTGGRTQTKDHGPLHVGIDLGTADVVVMVLEESGEPVATFLEWAEVVRDGVVVDFIGAADIVRRLMDKASQHLGADLASAATAFPPGTDPRLSSNILERAGLNVTAVQDEPSCIAKLLHLDRAAVVDIGGGTTGTAVVQKGEVVFSGDEPSGGRHISLAVAGHYNISFEEAEKRKLNPERYGILDLAHPTLQRISDIVAGHIQGHHVERIILSGGTCCLPGIDGIFAEELGLPVELPCQPLLLTPLSIASLNLL